MKSKLPFPISVAALPNFEIEINFNDGLQGIISLKHLVGKGVFELWNQYDKFCKVYINERNEIAWTDEIEIDSYNCYLKILKSKTELQNASS